MTLVLRKLGPQDEKTFMEAHNELRNEEIKLIVEQHYNEEMSFADLLQNLKDQENGVNMPEGFVPSTYYFGFVGNKLVGRIMVRHELNEMLRTYFGHVGYVVVPSERRKGYGMDLLRKVLPHAKEMHLDSVLVTCLDDNTISKKMIENAGGVFEKHTYIGEDKKPVALYWIKSPCPSTLPT